MPKQTRKLINTILDIKTNYDAYNSTHLINETLNTRNHKQLNKNTHDANSKTTTLIKIILFFVQNNRFTKKQTINLKKTTIILRENTTNV